jgi:coenzyme F420-dependent glucose-6-phosphate dehydrogenase
MIVGYHCSHEQHAPSTLLRNAELAGARGVRAMMCSDHFAPWGLQVPMCWARTEEEAERLAFEGWRTASVGSAAFKADTTMPEYFDDAAAYMRPRDIRASVRVSADLEQHREWLAQDRELGFDRVYLHQVGGKQDALIEVLPALQKPA